MRVEWRENKEPHYCNSGVGEQAHARQVAKSLVYGVVYRKVKDLSSRKKKTPPISQRGKEGDGGDVTGATLPSWVIIDDFRGIVKIGFLTFSSFSYIISH